MADLITLDEYKQFASIEGKKDNPQISMLITACSRVVQDYVGYDLGASTSITKKIRVRKGITEYMLPTFDVTLSSITYTLAGADPTTAKPIPESNYELSDTGLLEIFNIMVRDGDTITLEYQADKEATEAFKLATMLLVKFYFKEEFNKSSIAAGGQTVTYQVGKNFPPHIRAILMMYRLL